MPKVINLLGYHIAENIQKYIYENNLEPGDKIPSERELSIHYDVTRVTVRHGLQKLIDNGIIYTVANSGYFVAPHKVLRDSSNYFFPASDYFLNDYNYDKKEINSAFAFAHIFGIDNILGTDLDKIKVNSFIEKIDNIPISITFILQKKDTLKFYPELFNNKKPNHLLQKQKIRVYHANDNEMELLKINSADSLFMISENIMDENELIAVCTSICVGTRCEVQFNINT